MQLSSEQIEQVNAHGPFNHGVWSNGSFSIGNEERLRGRADLLARSLRQAITDHFSREQLAGMVRAD